MNKPLNIPPENWETVTLKDTANYFIDGDWIESEFIGNEGIRIIQTGNIGIGEYLDKPGTSKFINNESFKKLNCKKVFPGDVLICRLADPIGRCCIVPNTQKYYVTAVDVVIYRPKSGISKRFVTYLLNSSEKLRQMADKAGGSTRQRISRTNLGNINLTIPSLFKEQEKIASILSNVDSSIEKTEQLINKYKSIKQGLMQDLFRYGIDEKGQIRSEKTHKFKDSPLGRIPKEWDVLLLGELCTVTSSKRIYLEDYVSSGIPFYRSKEIIEKSSNQQTDDKEMLYISEKKYNNIVIRFGAPKKGDILITSVGTLGITYLIDDNDQFYFKDGNLIWLRDFSTQFNATFVNLFLPFWIRAQIDFLTIGTSQKAFTIEKLKKMYVLIPKKYEQDISVSKMNAADQAIKSEVATRKKLISIKQGLMYDLLTGKVRVNHLLN